MADTAAYLSCAILTIGAIFKLYQTRPGPRNPALRLWCALVLTLAAGAACLAPDSVRLLHGIEPTNTLATLLGDALKLTAACLVGLIGQTVRSPARIPMARWFLILALAIAAMAGLDAIADLPYLGAPAEGVRSRLALAGFDMIFMTYICTCLILAIRHVWRPAREAPRSQVRLGLRLSIAAAGAALLWTSWTVDDIFRVLTNGSQDVGDDTVSTFFEAFCALTATAGASFALWARWLRMWCDYRALGPLWHALHDEVPGIEFDAGWGAAPWSASFALYRRVIEIRDGILALGGHRHPDLWLWTVDCRPATVEAAGIAAAIEAHRIGRRFPAPAGGRPSGAMDALDTASGAAKVRTVSVLEPTLDAEAAWLTQVAREFQASPVVARIRRLTAEGGGAAGMSPG